MAWTGYRWRRLAREGNKLLLHGDGRSLAIQPVIKGEMGLVSVVLPGDFTATINLPANKSGTERLQAYYYEGMMPAIETVTVGWEIVYVADPVVYHYPGTKGFQSGLWIKVPYKEIYRREGGKFPVSGTIVEPVTSEKVFESGMGFEFNPRTGIWETRGGIIDESGKSLGGSIVPDHFTLKDEEVLAGYYPVDDDEFISATK